VVLLVVGKVKSTHYHSGLKPKRVFLVSLPPCRQAAVAPGIYVVAAASGGLVLLKEINNPTKQADGATCSK